MKKQIDQQAFNALALYQTAYSTQDSPSDSSLTPGLDFYNEYVWSSRGGTQEVKHTYYHQLRRGLHHHQRSTRPTPSTVSTSSSRQHGPYGGSTSSSPTP